MITLSIRDDGMIRVAENVGFARVVRVVTPEEARDQFAWRRDVRLTEDFDTNGPVRNEAENARRIAANTYFGLRTR